MLRVRLCGAVGVEADGRALPSSLLAGRQGRLVLAYLVCERHRAVPREELAELLWAEQLPDSWPTSLSAVISRLRRLLTEAGLDGTAALAGSAGSYRLHLPDGTWVDWEAAHASVATAEAALAQGDGRTALAASAEAAAIVEHGFLTDDCAWVDAQRDTARDLAVRAQLARAAAHLLEGSPHRAVETARAAVRTDPLREAGFRVLMQALAAAGERAEALRVWEQCRATLVDELGVDPSPETEAVYLEVLQGAPATAPTEPVTTALPSGVVTFLLTDIVDSTALWEKQPAAMAQALERHDAVVAEVVTAHDGTVLKSKLEGDATVSVFARATAGAHAALALRDALEGESWPEGAAPRVRMALHTGEAFERAGDYFGPALNRAARLRGLADGGQVLLSQAVAELVVDHLPEDVALADRGHRDLRGLSRGENVFELVVGADAAKAMVPAPLDRPPIPAALVTSGPFVGRGTERSGVLARWHDTGARANAILLAGEPGVGKSRLAAEVASAVHAEGGIVLYGRCDEELGSPLQPFVEALRPLVPAFGARRLRSIQGVDELGRIVPEVAELLPDARPTSQADPDAERYALFDAIGRLLIAASQDTPVLVVLDDLHWAGKTTLALLRHLLRSAEDARLLVVGTYRDTELARTHPLAATLADLHRDGTAERITLDGLDADDVAAYLEAVGRRDRALARELAQVTSGNPFFLIETVRHVEETGGTWEKGSLPQGVREATGRRLSQLSDAANDALTVAAVAGSAFALELVEAVRGTDLVDEIAEACQAGLVHEEPGAPGRFRFAHALVRQVLLAELVTVKRVRLHRAIAELLEADAGAEGDATLADLAHHWFECASSGNADKAVTYCRRAADRAMERLAHEEAADLYDMALQALEGAGDDGLRAQLLLARCDALLTAGEVGPARAAIDDLQRAAFGDTHLEAWHAVVAGQLAVLAEPDRLTEIVASIGAAATAMRERGDGVGEAKAHYVHALALERLGQIGAAERALDAALGAARQAGDRRLADAVLAGAPQAALWGPSPVSRASGRCLDVVRVLRITSGTPAVEAVALRCQAVLEALRGRTDTARKMIASSRRTLEELGLAHRLLETEVLAGLIELLDNEPVAAESRLRPAYEALRDRGLGGEAALAAALLGRALLQQDRDIEAEEVGEEASALAGADLKAAIAWRGVLAEAAARRGAHERARELAHAAVELATATDALLLVADARRSLASVLRAAGDAAGAAAEAQRTAQACDAKGATVLAERARAALGQATSPNAHVLNPIHDALSAANPFANAVSRAHERFVEAFSAGDWDGLVALFAPTWHIRDLRRHGSGDLTVEQSRASLRYVFDAGSVRWKVRGVLATRGDRLLLCDRRIEIVSRDGAVTSEVPGLSIWRIDEQGRRDLSVDFDEDDLDAAFDELDRLYLEGEAAAFRTSWAGQCALTRAISAADHDAALACFAPGFRFVGHGILGWGELDAPDFVAHTTETFSLRLEAEIRTRHVLALDERRSLTVASNSAEDYEVVFANVTEYDPEGRLVRRDSYTLDQLDEAWVRYHAIADRNSHVRNAAIRNHEAIMEAWEARDWDRVEALHAGWHDSDRRTNGGGDLNAADTLASLRYVFDHVRVRWVPAEFLATRGDRLVLLRGGWDLVGDGDQPGLRGLSIFRVDEHGRREYSVTFDAEDLDAAFEELDRLYEEGEGASARPDGNVPIGERFPNAVTRRAQLLCRAFNASDFDTFAELFAADYRFRDDRFRPVDLSREEYLASLAVRFEEQRDIAWQLRPLATRGDRLALLHHDLVVSDADASEVEVEVLVVDEVNEAGTGVETVLFAVDDLDAAYEELDRRFIAGEAAVGGALWERGIAFARAMSTRDVEAVSDWLAPGFRFFNHRALGWGELDGPGFVAHALSLFDMRPDARARVRHVLAIDEGRSLTVSSNEDAAGGGEFELLHVGVMEVDAEGRALRRDVYDLEQLDEAWARYEEISRVPTPTRELFTNAALRVHERFVEACEAGDFERLSSLYAPSWRISDRRANGSGDLTAAQSRASLRFFETGNVRAVLEDLMATRGDRLAMGRRRIETISNDGTVLTETHALSIWRVDEQGRRDLSIDFDENDLDAAYEELDRRYAETDDPPAAWEHVRQYVAAYNARDRDTTLALFAPEFRFTAHQPLGWGVLDRERYLDHVFELDAVRGDARLRIDHVLAVDDRRNINVGTIRDSAGTDDFALEAVMVIELGEHGLEIRRDAFRLTQLDEAWARYHEIAPAEVPLGAWFPNTATRRARDLHAPGRSTPLATRGDHLALVHLRQGSQSPESLMVVEVGADGLDVGTAVFAAGDLDGAYRELDRRYAEELGEGPGARWLADIATSVDSYNRRDSSVRPEPWASAGAIHDHRITGARTYGFDEWREAAGTLRDMAPEARVRLVHVIDAGDRGTFSCIAVVGTYESGPFEIPQFHVHEFRRDGAGVERIHIYDLDGLDAARAQWAALSAATT